jgi:hypothetical protein
MAALGHRPFEKTAEHSELVKLLVFNGTSEARIAAGLDLAIWELRYYFADELTYSQDRLLAQATKNVLRIANQLNDDGIALRANELVLRTHSPVWREPKQVEPEEPVLDRIESLTLEEVERELARLRGAGAADAGAQAAPPQGEPD